MASTAHDDPTPETPTIDLTSTPAEAVQRDALLARIMAVSQVMDEARAELMRISVEFARLSAASTITVIAPSTLAVHRIGSDLVIAPIAAAVASNGSGTSADRA